jgi:hypothetical protein
MPVHGGELTAALVPFLLSVADSHPTRQLA